MAEIVRMPKLSDTMTEGVVAKWHKKVGDTVKEGDLLAEIETDKATMEFESFVDGTLLYIGVKEKDAAPVDTILAIFGEKGEDYSALLKDKDKTEEKPQATEKSEAKVDNKKEEATEKIDTSGIKASIVKMPKLSDTMTEGVVAKWHKKVGDKVASGDLLAEIETDKATMEFESFEDGVLLHIGIEEGGSAPVDAILAIIGEKGADFETLIKAEKAGANKTEEKLKQAEETKAQPKEETKTTSTASAQTQNNTATGSRIIASPLAKKIAQDRNINLSLLKGSG
ncbi:MAG: E3 binding domain-containing protein, partial [Vicingaceae bacterium]|nr:E3 binding domain-containing protein [Vicingaceae bacterium]